MRRGSVRTWFRTRVLRRPTPYQLSQILRMDRLQGAVLILAITCPIVAIWAFANRQWDWSTWFAFPASVALFLLFNFMVLRMPDEPAYKWMRRH